MLVNLPDVFAVHESIARNPIRQIGERSFKDRFRLDRSRLLDDLSGPRILEQGIEELFHVLGCINNEIVEVVGIRVQKP